MASKEWTQEQRERAAEQIQAKHNINFTERHKHSVESTLQCELNEARELFLESPEGWQALGKVQSWLSRNK